MPPPAAAKLDLQMTPVSRAELVHHADARGVIVSLRNRVEVRYSSGVVQRFALPERSIKWPGMALRPVRRVLRLDKMVVRPTTQGENWRSLVIIRGGQIFHADLSTGSLRRTGSLRQSRNPLHQSICVTDSGAIIHGEYGSNPRRTTVPVYKSVDGGASWTTAYEFPAGKTRHVHGCFWDAFERKVWVCTGDFAQENHVLVADEDFEILEWLGDGSQTWRTCHPMFSHDVVIWGMDSQLETSHICRLDRATRTLERLRPLPGPVWYAKHLSDGWMVVATVVERGDGVHDDHAHVMVSRDAEAWETVLKVRKDALPMPTFKNGVINFATGRQSSAAFYLSGEAFSGLDGRVMRARLVQR